MKFNYMMIRSFIIPGLIILSCSSVKNNQSVKTDSLPASVEQTLKDSVKEKNITDLPTCIKNKIDSFKVKEVHERPQKVVEYQYKGKKVYYVVMPCCDFFNEVYDDKCNFLGSPDGGFTGKGDGKLPGFFAEVKNEKLVWESPK